MPLPSAHAGARMREECKLSFLSWWKRISNSIQHINCLGSRVPIVEVVEREISRIESKREILPVCMLPVVIYQRLHPRIAAAISVHVISITRNLFESLSRSTQRMNSYFINSHTHLMKSLSGFMKMTNVILHAIRVRSALPLTSDDLLCHVC